MDGNETANNNAIIRDQHNAIVSYVKQVSESIKYPYRVNQTAVWAVQNHPNWPKRPAKGPIAHVNMLTMMTTTWHACQNMENEHM